MSLPKGYRVPESVLAQLPGVLGQVAQIAGPRAAVALAQARGGCRAYIPRPEALGDEHWLVRALGPDAARAVARELGGGEVEVPLGPFAGSRAGVWAAIERALNEGLSVDDAARRAGVSARTVRRHKTGETAGQAEGWCKLPQI